jgi:hypothetical protein
VRVHEAIREAGSVHEWNLPSKHVAATAAMTNNRQLRHSHYVYHQLMRHEEAGGAVLLHFAVCSFETFWRKRWAQLGYASPNHRFRGGGSGLEQRANALALGARREEAHAFYRRSMMIVDEREKQAEFHKTLSFLSILRDGTVVIAGPGGEEIRMGGGNVEISCPGDIQLRPGRSCVTLAGRDAIVRANKSVEISANTEDVRIKSDRNMQLLAGNSGVGGMLIESKSIGELQDYSKVGNEVVSNGITLKSKSFVSCLGMDVYLRSYDAGYGFGQVIIDAAAGEGSIVTTARDTLNYNVTGLYQYFGPTDAPTGVNQYTDQISKLSGGLTCSYGVAAYINGGLVTKGSIAIVDGHVASTADTPFVGTLKGESLDQVRASFEDLAQQEQTAKEQASDFYETSLTERIHGDNRVGNEKVLKQMGFSFRTSDQYRAGGFTLFESRWAQVARTTSQSSTYWQEKIVKANEQSTMPYPGFEAWTSQSGYCKVDNKLYINTGPLPTGKVYEEAPSSELQKSAAENSYPVIS